MATPSNLPLPEWVIVTFFIIGGLATLLEIVRFAIYLVKQPCLEIRLTKEMFIRLIEEGEGFFLNSVLLGRNGTTEILDVVFDLVRTSGSEKRYRLNPIRIGQKVGGQGPVAGFTFYTQSPKAFLTRDESERPVILAVLEEHRALIKKAFLDFDDLLYEKRNELRNRVPQSEEESKALVNEGAEYLENLVGRFLSEMSDFIQVENGDYRLTIVVKYIPAPRLFRSEKSASSSIVFTIDDGYRKAFRRQLQNTLRIRGQNVLFEMEKNYMFPEFQPTNIGEV